MPTPDQIRGAIKAKIAAVANAGVVHDFERYADENESLAALYVAPALDKVRGWLIQRAATRETRPAVGRYVIVHRWRIKLYAGLVDADESEKLFDSLIEAVRDAIRADETLGGVVADVSDGAVAGLQVDDAGPVMFCGVLAHGATMTLYTKHFS